MWRWIGAIGAVAVLAVLAMGGGAQQAPAADETKTAIFAGGCFWCVEAAFDEVPGVTETVSGYAGGTKPNPNYGDHEGYQEAVKITYDPAKVSYDQLLDTYWHNIDPFEPGLLHLRAWRGSHSSRHRIELTSGCSTLGRVGKTRPTDLDEEMDTKPKMPNQPTWT